MYCLPLGEPLRSEMFGAKAASLSTMLRSGMPVPNGFAISSEALDRNTRDDVLPETLVREIAAHLGTLAPGAVMVRSSAIGEDSDAASFAGQLGSFVCDGEIDSVVAGVRRCRESYDRENVAIYERAKGVALRGMGIVVQELVDPEYAGVLFTRAPDDPSSMLCEYVEGHGEQLVSGAVDPMRYRCARAGGAPDRRPPFDADVLHRHALRLEELFDGALDIEWVVADGICWIVQSRPITVAAAGGRVHWSNTNVNENYPGPITPLLYSIARESYYHYFKNLSRLLQVPEDAIRELEPAYANIVGAWGCRLYYNMTSIHAVIGRSPFAAMLRGAFDDFVGYQEGPAAGATSSRLRSAVRFVRRFIALNAGLERSVCVFEERVDAYARRSSDARGHAELRACFHEFIEIRMHGWYRASLADFFAMVYHGVVGRLCRRSFGDEHQGIHNTMVQAIPGLVSGRPVAAIWRIATMIRDDDEALALLREKPSLDVRERFARDARFAAIHSAIEAYLATWGFRCSGELMLTEENFCDAPERFIDLLRGYVEQPGDDPETIIAAKAAERRALMRGLRWRLIRRRGLLAPLALLDIAVLHVAVRLCFAGIASRERVRLKQADLYHRFKRVLRAIGDELATRGVIESADDVLFLRYQELAEHLSTSDMLVGTTREVIALRRAEHERASVQRYPDDFATVDGVYTPPERVQHRTPRPADAGVVRGLSACGGFIRGRVRVLQSVMELSRIEAGDILVTRQTDPGWATVFPLISGLIVERGGMLSHGAIVAREFGIPAIVGVPNATTLFTDGDEIELDGDRGEVWRVGSPQETAVESSV
jgi:rifampicin phosphotransferase